MGESNTTSLLFVQIATSCELRQLEDGRVTVVGNVGNDTYVFSDRPQRLAFFLMRRCWAMAVLVTILRRARSKITSCHLLHSLKRNPWCNLPIARYSLMMVYIQPRSREKFVEDLFGEMDIVVMA